MQLVVIAQIRDYNQLNNRSAPWSLFVGLLKSLAIVTTK
jgi:hypothetical protein